MFGLVRAYKPEMKFKEYETYKALYCTLCRKLGREYGFLARMTLDYDSVFMIMLAMSTDGEPVCYEQKRCCCNPIKKCNYCTTADPAFEYSAAVLVLLTAAKLEDNSEDTRGLKRLFWKIARSLFSSASRKAGKKYPGAAEDISVYMREQKAAESGAFRGIDASAEPTASVMKKLFSRLSTDGLNNRVFAEIGYYLGKWIYIADAAADAKRDAKTGNFNPLLLSDTAPSVKQKSEPLLNSCAVRIAEDFSLLEVKKYKSILENIIYFGLKEVQKTIYGEKK